ncbi:sensor histidine kinase [Pseudomonas sp. Marseille-Q5115]|uniref:sensor histidine kinase n=1 Tax=Pseudomonas sp. Marseille-Q5115 TaxID=2866593 RepID=UPI001CE46A71|nr:ATP-binding protein [Pseudomonas sp. Marseille-Q5115]
MTSLGIRRHLSMEWQGLWGFTALLVACCIFIVDTATRLDTAVAVLYVAVLLMLANRSSAKTLLWVAAACAGLTLLAFALVHGHPAVDTAAAWARCIISLAAIGITTLLALRGKRATQALLEAQAQLAHASRVTTLGELAASIAHEVNQPLAAIANNSGAGLRWLQRPRPELAEACESLQRVAEDAHRASEVVARIRALARKSEPVRQSLCMDALITDTLALIRGELSRHRVRARLGLDTAEARVLADPVQVQQVLINLLINACQAMAGVAPRARELYIESRVQGPWLSVSIRDGGAGIPASVLPGLFTPFFSTRQDGLGMGLSICRSLIEAQGGRISATNASQGGACFVFRLPLVSKKAAR